MSREDKLKLMGLIILVGLVSAIGYNYVMADYWKLPYPHNTFLFRPEDRFNDFRNFYNLLTHPGAPNPLRSNVDGVFQGGWGVVIFVPFILLGLTSNAAALLFLILFTIVFVLICRKQLAVESYLASWKNALLFSLCTYPFLFNLDRGSYEGVLVIFVYYFIQAMQRQRYNLAMWLLAITIGMKPFPGVFLILFLERKLYKQVLGVGIIAAGLTVLACLVRLGSISSLLHPQGLGNYQEVYAIGNEGVFFGNSLWSVVKILVYGYSKLVRPIGDLHGIASVYLWVSAGSFIALSWWIVCRQLPLWKKVALLVCAMNLLPFVSGDYKLLHLMVPLFLFVNHSAKDRLDFAYCLLFALLLIPKAYGHLPWPFNEANIGVLLNPLLMMGMVVTIVISGWRKDSSEPALTVLTT